jgi:hypothetical protein
MTVLFKLGLPHIREPGSTEHERVMRALIAFKPDESVRDVQYVDDRLVFHEIGWDGAFRLVQAGEEEEVMRNDLGRLGSFVSFSNELAEAYHTDVATLGVPYRTWEPRILRAPGYALDGCRVRFVNEQADRVAIDSESEILADFGLGREDAAGINARIAALARYAVAFSMLTSYG